MAVTMIEKRCPQNHTCPAVKACSIGALSQKAFNVPVVDTEKCMDCGQCVEVCPRGALVLNK